MNVAKRVALGMTNKEIAAELDLSVGTIKTHMTHSMNKLGARNRVELALMVARGEVRA